VSGVEPDPRWEWASVQTFGDPEPVLVQVRCLHLEVVPVESISGEVVAHLCLICDHQFGPEWVSA
jgi:hypothetical protein